MKVVNPLRIVQDVLHHAQKSDETKHHRVASAGLDARIEQLREFQCQRIARTYADFAAQPQYAPALDFFLNDLYAPRDFTQRDYDAERLHNFLKKFVPAELLKLSTDSIELTQLSNALDEKMVGVLKREVDAPNVLTDALYAQAYRRCNNYSERERQIELLVCVMRDSADTAHMVLTGPALRMARGPAHAAGWHEMYDFLERGHQAFAKIKKPEKFLRAIEERETRIMERLARGDAQPFRE